MTGAASVLKVGQKFFLCLFLMIFRSILHKISFHLPPPGLAIFCPKLLLSNFETIAPMTITFEYRSYRPILSNMEVGKNSDYITPWNEAPQPLQGSPMGPSFFLAYKPFIYSGLSAYEPGGFPKKGPKPENRLRTGSGPIKFDFGAPLGIFQPKC